HPQLQPSTLFPISRANLHPLLILRILCYFFFFNATATTEIYTLSLHDALPISETAEVPACNVPSRSPLPALAIAPETKLGKECRSEERFSRNAETDLVCRLLLEKKKKLLLHVIVVSGIVPFR